MDKIVLKNIRLYAYHGCFEEEKRLGAEYRIDIKLFGNFDKAAEHDDLSETINYVQVFDIIKREMAIRSKLIESVNQRILNSVFNEVKGVKKIKLRISKVHPPLGAEVGSFQVVSTRKIM